MSRKHHVLLIYYLLGVFIRGNHDFVSERVRQWPSPVKIQLRHKSSKLVEDA